MEEIVHEVVDYAARIKAAKAIIRDRLVELQFRSPKKLLLMRQDPTGLGGQISRRILGLRLGLYYDRTVVFTRDDDWPYTQSFERCYAPDLRVPSWDETPDFDFNGPNDTEVAKFNFWKWWEDRARDDRFLLTTPSCLADVPESSRIYDGILLSFLTLRPAMEAIVQSAVTRFNIADNAVGVHIRRGDKNVETPYLSIATIAAETRRLLDRAQIARVFLATDDPDVRDKLAGELPCEIIYDATEARHNNANHRFLMKHHELAEIETTTAIRNIMLLSNCYMIVGQSNAHFATLAASLISARRHTTAYGHLIPGDLMLRQSRLRRLGFWLKKQPRALAKRVLPSRTIRSRGANLK